MSAIRRPTRPLPIIGVAGDPGTLSALMVAVLAFGAAGFGFGAYFYLVPYHRKAALVERLSRELRARGAEPRLPAPPPVAADPAAARAQGAMKALEAEIGQRLASAGVTVTVGPQRLVVRLPEDKTFDARGPYLSKGGQETVEALGTILGTRVHRVVVAAPMGGATVPRWVRAQLPTPADLSAARAGNALKPLLKGGVRAEAVLAVVGSLVADDATPLPTLDFEIEP